MIDENHDLFEILPPTPFPPTLKWTNVDILFLSTDELRFYWEVHVEVCSFGFETKYSCWNWGRWWNWALLPKRKFQEFRYVK